MVEGIGVVGRAAVVGGAAVGEDSGAWALPAVCYAVGDTVHRGAPLERGMSTPVMTPAATAAVEYPSSDGKPMAESDVQRLAMVYAMAALEIWFADCDDVYVSGDLLMCREAQLGWGLLPSAASPPVVIRAPIRSYGGPLNALIAERRRVAGR